MDLYELPEATGFPNTNIKAKLEKAKELLKTNKYDFIWVHIKAADSLGEDGNIQGKKEFIEKIDQAISTIKNENIIIGITADHSTPCEDKTHSADPVPILISGSSEEKDDITKFTEEQCKNGKLGTLQGKDFMNKFTEIIKNS